MSKTVADEASTPGTSSLILAADALAGSVRDSSWNEEQHGFPSAVYCLAHLVANESCLSVGSTSEESLQVLFSDKLAENTRRFIAASLLRIVPHWKDQRSVFRAKCVELIEETVGDEIFPQLKLTSKAENFQKIAKLASAMDEIEHDLAIKVRSISDLKGRHSFRQAFMKSINSPLSKAIIVPFIPTGLLGTRLTELFIAVDEFADAIGPRILANYEDASRILRDYEFDARNFGTYYSASILGTVAQTLHALLQQSFEESSYSVPAQLSLESSDKKYRLFDKSSTLRLVLVVSNLGEGHAADVVLGVRETTAIKPYQDEIYLGRLEPGTCINPILEARVDIPGIEALGEFDLRWRNFDGTEGHHPALLEFTGQRSDLEWETLEQEDPYALNPVTTEDELLGRSEILNQLISQARPDRMGSSIVFGQKRVGKTSIVRTLKSHLEREGAQKHIVVYVEGGDYVDPDPGKTINNLGDRLVDEIQRSDHRLTNLEKPGFDSALSPLAKFLVEVERLAPDYRVTFVLDEFDELPIELYKRGSVADSFFLTLRSISNKDNAAFILVGGEKMEHLLSSQGDQVNRFEAIRVEYFDRQKHWIGFRDLVLHPVAHWMEITEAALTMLYEETAGNPYFTKLICRTLARMMVQRRDAHVTDGEMDEAIHRTIEEVKSNSFQHFWEDGIFESGPRAEEISLNRRRILLSVTETQRAQIKAEKNEVIERARSLGLDSREAGVELNELVRRRVLSCTESSKYGFAVPFFGRWLSERGTREMITSVVDGEGMATRKQEEDAAYVRSDEIVQLCDRWGTYQGQLIGEERVRAWLSQFGSNADQRLMFRILEGLQFYSSSYIREAMRNAHAIARRDTHRFIDPKKRKDVDFVVSYLDHLSKSGARHARVYVEENSITVRNIVTKAELGKVLELRDDVKVVVFVDDFLGTGGSALKYFADLYSDIGSALNTVRLVFVAVSGFLSAKERVQRGLEELGLPVHIHVCDPLDTSYQVFSDKSRIFSDLAERERARQIALQTGKELVKSNPLGFGDCEAVVVFDENCPNNTLPILWAEKGGWVPLFRRQI